MGAKDAAPSARSSVRTEGSWIYHVKVEAPIEQADDIEAATSECNLDHPGAIIPPDDWLPNP